MAVGGQADLCVFDPNDSWRLEPATLRVAGGHQTFARYAHTRLPIGLSG